MYKSILMTQNLMGCGGRSVKSEVGTTQQMAYGLYNLSWVVN